MFFLRCAFWLSIVYGSMSWTPGSFAPAEAGRSLVAVGQSQAEALARTAAAKASDFCMRHAQECLADAAQLTSLFAGANRVDEDDARQDEITASIPLPVPDPRRHARDAKLARAP